MGILEGKVAIVTGATRGIGRGIADEYAKEGAKVAVVSRTKASVDAVAAEIRKAGGTAAGIVCDLGDGAAITRMVEETVKTFGGVDILVNNAQGFGTRAKPEVHNPDTLLEDFSEEQWDWVFETGVKATFRSMKAVFPHMKARGGGSIINFGSRRGIIGSDITAAYNACKEAIRGLSRTGANAWGKYGIRVNVINPIIVTDAARANFANEQQLEGWAKKNIPMGRWGTPQDCGRIAVFLAGPDSSYLTGMTFFVEGGVTSLP